MILEATPRSESMFIELQDMEQGENPTPNVSLTNGLDSSASNHYSTAENPPRSPPESAATQYTWMPETTRNNRDLNGHQSPEYLSSSPRWEEAAVNSNGEIIYKCDACTFTTLDKLEYDTHANTHVDHKCCHCDYTSRAEGRLKRHIREFHSDVESNIMNWTDKDTDGEKTTANGHQAKRKRYKCRQCSIYFDNKSELWKHTRTHIKVERQLSCPDCAFVTEYKHHLEYHLRNHAGAKPFKCSKCDYTCVNKSMLNSHMKSHSSFLPYQCSSCQYGTKYIHSLKIHLRKYNHDAAVHFKFDGTRKIHTRIDANGTRKGPKTKKSKEKSPPRVETNEADNIHPINSQDNVTITPNMYYSYHHQMYLPSVSQSTTHNGYTSPLMVASGPGTVVNEADPVNDPVLTQPSTSYLYCNLCGFTCGTKDTYNNHLLTHAAKENEDLFRVFDINADSFSTADMGVHVSSSYPFYQFYPKNGYALNYFRKPNSSGTPPVNGNVPISPGQNSNPPTADLRTENEETADVSSLSNNTTNSEPTPLDLSNGKSSPKEAKVEISAPQELSRNRRKGKAFKLGRRYIEEHQEDDRENEKAVVPIFETHKINGLCTDDVRLLSLEPFDATTKQQSYHCPHCEMTFSDWVMHALHMRFHDQEDPFKCSECGKQCKDRRTFFMHIAEAAHG